MSQCKELLVASARLRLPKEDVEAFAFLEMYEKNSNGQTRSVKDIKEIRQETMDIYQQWMKAVKHIAADKPFHEHTNERTAHRAMLKFIFGCELPNPHIELLNITVEEEYASRDEDEIKILMYNQIFEKYQL